MSFGKRKEPQKEAITAVPTTSLEKFKNLFALSKQLDVKHETTNSLVRLGSKNIVTIPSISTLLPTFDYDVMGCGGIPRGRIVEIFGPESAGKTTFTLWVAGQEQKQGGIVAFVDAEHALDPGYAQQLGVDTDNLIINQPDSGEKALQVVDALVDSHSVSLIVVDSVSALVPEAELAGEIGDIHVGLQARMMSQALRILTAKADRNNVTIFWINQLREKIGVMYGNPETTSGGRALKFYASVRIDVRRKEPISHGSKENLVGHTIRLKAVKNKVGTPLRETTVDLYYPNTPYPTGFDTVGDLITYAVKCSLFEMKGSWFWFEGERLANGLESLKSYLRSNKELLDTITKKVGEHVKDQSKTEGGSNI